MLNVECSCKLTICDEDLITNVINCAFTVHKELGSGLLESVYERALLFELKEIGLDAVTQVEIPVMYRGKNLGVGFRADIIVSDSFLVELKSVEKISHLHLSQVITYLKLLRYKRGIIFNFNTSLLKNGIKRVSI